MTRARARVHRTSRPKEAAPEQKASRGNKPGQAGGWRATGPPRRPPVHPPLRPAPARAARRRRACGRRRRAAGRAGGLRTRGGAASNGAEQRACRGRVTDVQRFDVRTGRPTDGWTVGRSSGIGPKAMLRRLRGSPRDHHVPPLVPHVDVAVRLHDPLHGIAPVDQRLEPTRLGQAGEKAERVLAPGR